MDAGLVDKLLNLTGVGVVESNRSGPGDPAIGNETVEVADAGPAIETPGREKIYHPGLAFGGRIADTTAVQQREQGFRCGFVIKEVPSLPAVNGEKDHGNQQNIQCQ